MSPAELHLLRETRLLKARVAELEAQCRLLEGLVDAAQARVDAAMDGREAALEQWRAAVERERHLRAEVERLPVVRAARALERAVAGGDR